MTKEGGVTHRAGARKRMITRQVLEMATIGGGRTIWLDDRVGSLSPGKQADIVMLRPDGVDLKPVGRAAHTVAAAVLNAGSANVGGEPCHGALSRTAGG